MSFLSFGLNQKCTYWKFLGIDGYGKPSFSAPVVISCRWEGRTEKVQADDGEERMSRARVFLENDVAAGDYLALGEHAGLDPRRVLGAWKIITYRTTPGLQAEIFERKAYL